MLDQSEARCCQADPGVGVCNELQSLSELLKSPVWLLASRRRNSLAVDVRMPSKWRQNVDSTRSTRLVNRRFW